MGGEANWAEEWAAGASSKLGHLGPFVATHISPELLRARRSIKVSQCYLELGVGVDASVSHRFRSGIIVVFTASFGMENPGQGFPEEKREWSGIGLIWHTLS
ncbi:hypothetical protein MLD38_027672 [Melastoma candidum]|uniref:Uncharacterized protein n=1 Tax=Melastoma candidum TaxID=119954 RepID=A0ACB9P2H4_9MYRT|nr:hypothetical protein MLD38_027672 [Melastoma candidum]